MALVLVNKCELTKENVKQKLKNHFAGTLGML